MSHNISFTTLYGLGTINDTAPAGEFGRQLSVLPMACIETYVILFCNYRFISDHDSPDVDIAQVNSSIEPIPYLGHHTVKHVRYKPLVFVITSRTLVIKLLLTLVIFDFSTVMSWKYLLFWYFDSIYILPASTPPALIFWLFGILVWLYIFSANAALKHITEQITNTEGRVVY
jgi:hypothetical protein